MQAEAGQQLLTEAELSEYPDTPPCVELSEGHTAELREW